MALSILTTVTYCDTFIHTIYIHIFIYTISNLHPGVKVNYVITQSVMHKTKTDG